MKIFLCSLACFGSVFSLTRQANIGIALVEYVRARSQIQFAIFFYLIEKISFSFINIKQKTLNIYCIWASFGRKDQSIVLHCI